MFIPGKQHEVILEKYEQSPLLQFREKKVIIYLPLNKTDIQFYSKLKNSMQ
jgi:hypothetical protein